MVEMMIEKFEKLGYTVSVEETKFEILEKNDKEDINPYSSIYCDNSGIYSYGDRDYNFCCSLNGYESNILAMYFMVDYSRSIIRSKMNEDLNRITNASSIDKIKSIFLKYLDKQFLSNRINCSLDRVVSDAFNFSQENKMYNINYVENKKYINITTTSDVNNAYRNLLIYAILRKKYEEKLGREFPNMKLDEEIDLNLFSIYSKGNSSIIKSKTR